MASSHQGLGTGVSRSHACCLASAAPASWGPQLWFPNHTCSAVPPASPVAPQAQANTLTLGSPPCLTQWAQGPSSVIWGPRPYVTPPRPVLRECPRGLGTPDPQRGAESHGEQGPCEWVRSPRGLSAASRPHPQAPPTTHKGPLCSPRGCLPDLISSQDGSLPVFFFFLKTCLSRSELSPCSQRR